MDDDRKEFICWVLDSVGIDKNKQNVDAIDKATIGYSAASFSALRSLLKSKNCKTINQVIEVSSDLIESDIAAARRCQNLQALLNCTRKSLLPRLEKSLQQQKKEWRKEIRELEANGI
jgi:mannose-6-phosphate isomerase class I